MSTKTVKAALDLAITEVADQHNGIRDFSRNRKLSQETVLRLLIGAEGGSLAKILHETGIDATPAALSQRRAQIAPAVFQERYSTVSMPHARTMALSEIIAFWPVTVHRSIWHSVTARPKYQSLFGRCSRCSHFQPWSGTMRCAAHDKGKSAVRRRQSQESLIKERESQIYSQN